MTDTRTSSGAGPTVCPFVALAEDRDRRADTPDEANRCYAERAPRRRDLVYQSEYCYSPDFARCSVFLTWAARNAAAPAAGAPADRSGAAAEAWGSDQAWPEGTPGSPADASPAVPGGTAAADGADTPLPSPEGGLFGPAASAVDETHKDEQLDWVSASAWAEAPWDERAELEAEELEELAEEEDLQLGLEAEEQEREEATQAPKVPAALPMRRRKPPQEPIRSHGSGEWYYADPPGRQPLVSRRSGVTPAILLAVLGVLLVSIVVFLVAAGIGSDDELPPVAAASPSAAASFGPTATRAPAATAAPSLEPSPTPKPKIQTWTVRPGQSLSWIAARPRVSVDIKLLQCINRITNPDIIQPGQVLRIPPEGYECPKGWRKSTPEPLE